MTRLRFRHIRRQNQQRSSFMIRIRMLAAAVALTLGTVAPFAIQSANAKAPVVLNSSSTPTTLTIHGEQLGPGAANVLLGAFGPLTVVSQTSTQLVVTLPTGLLPGNYVLSVQVGKGKGEVDESIVTIGAVGPCRPATGARRIPRSSGTRWFCRCNWSCRGPARSGPAGPGCGPTGAVGPSVGWVPSALRDRKGRPATQVRWGLKVPPALPAKA